MTDRGKPIAGFPRSLENAGAFPTFPPHDHYDSPSTKETNLRRYDRENRFHLTDADHLGHNRFTGVASLRARYRHRPESLSTSRRNALSTSPEYASWLPGHRRLYTRPRPSEPFLLSFLLSFPSRATQVHPTSCPARCSPRPLTPVLARLPSVDRTEGRAPKPGPTR
jgi:hypothetical protein